MTTEIPNILKKFNFVLLAGEDGKTPIEKMWTSLTHKVNDLKLLKHLDEEKNYGIRCGITSPINIENELYNLLVVDFDNEELQNKIIDKLPETFTVKTGGKGLFHLYFASNNAETFKIFDSEGNTLCDVLGEGKQCVGPNSTNFKTNRKYEIVKNIPISFIDYSELKAMLMICDKRPKKMIKEKSICINGYNIKDTNDIINSISMKEVLEELNIDTSKNPTNCPFHESKGGKCLGWNEETVNCFHCGNSWNKYSLLKKVKGLNDKETFEWFAKKGGNEEKLKKSRKDFILEKKNNSNNSNNINEIFTKIGQVREFLKHQPIYYERKNQFWIWNFEKYCWEEKDETDLLNSIRNNLLIDTINSKEKSEILEALKQLGRENKPLDIKPSWVQFKDKIYDIENDEIFEASPKYFVANPIDWKIGDSEETPNIDKLIESWVSKEDIPKLFEIIGFTPIPKLFIHSFFFLFGPPGHGKTTFVNLLIKFIGQNNCTATSLDRINHNSRFETYNWNKKLLITLSEVSNIDDLKNSGLINQATGEDPLKCEIKGGTTFDFTNYGKFIYPSNKLVKIDSEDGFGRRVRIINFTHRFEKEKDIISNITDKEFENLAKKSLRIAKELWKNRQFTGDVSISERMQNYQEVSKTKLELFIDKKCDLTDSDSKILFDEFYAKYISDYGTSKSKIIISKELRKLGFIIKLENWQEEKLCLDGQKMTIWTSGTRINGIKWK